MKFLNYTAIALASAAFAFSASAQDADSTTKSYNVPRGKVTITTTATPNGPAYNVSVEPSLVCCLDSLREIFKALIAAQPESDHEFIAIFNAIEAAISQGATPASGPITLNLATGKDENGNPTMTAQTTVAGQKVDVSGVMTIDERGFFKTEGSITVTNLYTDEVTTNSYDFEIDPLKTVLVGHLGDKAIDVAIRMHEWALPIPDVVGYPVDDLLDPKPDPSIEGSGTN